MSKQIKLYTYKQYDCDCIRNSVSYMAVMLKILLVSSLISAAWGIPKPKPTIAVTPTTLSNGIKNTSAALILRVRLEDGSIDKIQLDSDNVSINQLLERYSLPPNTTIIVANKVVEDDRTILSSLDLKNGTIITIQQQPSVKSCSDATHTETPKVAATKQTFQPFPELAKNLKSAIRARSRRRTSGMASYGDLANIHSSLHLVEPQLQGPIQRVYMCSTCAERFHSSCCSSKSSPQNRLALLLGTVQRERVDLKPPKTRTSLSSIPSGTDYCEVAKVHAIWEPPQASESGQPYDPSVMLKREESFRRILQLATQLGLQPIGWIFSYSENRHELHQDGLPVWAQDVKTGSLLQIEEMKDRPLDGTKFVTLAMAGKDGATEAFQISNVAVQMVSEDVLLHDMGRHVSTRFPVLVDGKETSTLDSVLCLINIALLSHIGRFAGTLGLKITKKNGTLTTKTKKAILQAMSNDQALLPLLCDFRILVALDRLLPTHEVEELCRVVQKWSLGLKQSTTLPPSLQRSLQSVIST